MIAATGTRRPWKTRSETKPAAIMPVTAVTGMSQGTRDQLFLALRIAAIEEHLLEREAIPIAIDDLLVQFDDARAAATLTVLAELARRAQVLFFTHHGHLCELAAAALPSDAWRRHDLSADPIEIPMEAHP